MTTTDDHRHHRRRRAFNGMAAGVIAFAMFLGVAAACGVFVGNALGDLQAARTQTAHNAEAIKIWDFELRARHINVEDLQHFLPAHGHPTPNPPSPDPHTTPSAHR